ncbi:MAG: hypothetical protein NC418_06225 [Muribaculaceae bacterium]|nr:hypothetical protein [Muribaculaceae bacterium]
MYKVTVTAGGTTATAAKQCHTKEEAEIVKEKLCKLLQMPVSIEITHIGKPE